MPRASQHWFLRLSKIGGLAVLSSSLTSDLPAAEIDFLDGRTLQGTVQSWGDSSLEIETEEGLETVRTEDILRIRFAPAADSEPYASVELTDGSLIPIDQFTVQDGEATVRVPGVTEPLAVPTKMLNAVHLLPPTPAIAAQWDKLRQVGEAGDLIVIRKEDAVDYVAGRLGDVTETHVLFFVDRDEYRVERSKVDGLIYYRPQKATFAEPRCVLRGSDGLALAASSVHMEDDTWHVRTNADVELAVARDRIASADLSGGKVVYLSELTPRSVKTTPLVALPASADLAARTVEPVIDRGFFSSAALLRHPRLDGERIVGWELKPHRRSLGLRSHSEIVYSLPEGFSGFRAIAGLDGTLGGRGNVHVSVFGDDRPLWEQEIDGSDPPATIETDVAGVRRLRIVVDYGRRGDAGDRLYLCEARLTK